ncbi:MAG: 4-hydroxy-tetrahydrodipicolinate synthase [Flavobacteriales bacterium]|nr:4-hydroxy-tetrahydrodipicolinate synthase [Flavobacteriales bacterium]
MNTFKGTGVAIVTPFKDDRSVDYIGLEKLVEHLISGGVNYLVVNGTTGESATLSRQEKLDVLASVIKFNNKRLPIVFGIGGNNTQDIVDCFKTYDFTGVDAILSVSPFYNKPSQEGIYQHYKAIAEVSPLPLILYNVPARTGSHMEAETVLRLAKDFKNIIGVKEASGVIFNSMKIIKNRPEGFLVLSGDDILNLPIIASGGDGIISVIANAFPSDYSKMVKSALAGDFRTAQQMHYKYFDMVHYMFVDGNPPGIKATLKILGICKDTLRLPLVNVSSATYQALENLIKNTIN